MQRGLPTSNKTKVQNGKANWSSVINQANQRNNQSGNLNSTSDNTLNQEVHRDINGVQDVSKQHGKQEDFPALPLQRASSCQAPTKQNLANEKVTVNQKPANSANSNPSTTENVSKGVQQQQRQLGETQTQDKFHRSTLLLRKEDVEEESTESLEARFGIDPVVRFFKKDPPKYSISYGVTVDKLRLPVNDKSSKVYDNFISPWVYETSKLKPPSKDPNVKLPDAIAEFKINQQVPPYKHIQSYSHKTLLYIFYSMPKDLMQELSAQELYIRGWRYHKERQLWMLKKVQDNKFNEDPDSFEVFYPRSWETKVEKIVLAPDTFEVRHINNPMQQPLNQQQSFNNEPLHHGQHMNEAAYGPAQNPNVPMQGMNSNAMYKQQVPPQFTNMNQQHLMNQQQFMQVPPHQQHLPPVHLNQQQFMQVPPHQQHLPPVHPSMYNVMGPHFNPNMHPNMHHIGSVPHHMLPPQHQSNPRMKEF